MNISVFIFCLMLLQAVCWWMGKRSVKEVKTQNDYYLGGGSVAFFPLMATFLATQVGGGLVLGASEEAKAVGWWVLLYPLGQVLGLIVLGCGIGRRLSGFKVSTIAQIFEVYYGSQILKKAASLLSIVSLFMILIGQVLASKRFLFSLGVDDAWIFLVFWGILIAYTSMGGMKAVIATDLIQAFFLIAVFLFAFAVAYFGGGAPEAIQRASLDMPTEKFCGWLLLPFLFTFIEQDMGQRCFAASSPKTLAKASIGAGLFAFAVALIPIYFGMRGDGGQGSVLMSAVALATNPVASALVGCGVIAAILSTANSLINAVGSNLSEDFFASKASMSKIKALSALIGVAALFASYAFSSIVDVLMLSYELSIACLFVPLMIALFSKKRGSFYQAATSMLFGAVGFFLFRQIALPIPKELAEILLSAVGFVLGAYVRNRQKISTRLRS